MCWVLGGPAFILPSLCITVWCIESVLHRESSTRLAPPRNTKDRKHLQSTQTTVNRHNSQTKHLELLVSKGQPGSRDTQHQPAQLPCTPSAQQPPAITRNWVITRSSQPTQPAAKHRRAEPHYTTDITRLSGDTQRPPH